MNARWLVLGLLIVFASLAFAPAPFPRTERKSKLYAPSIQGTWQGGSTIEITPTQLNYHPGPGSIQYVLTLNAHAHPATYDLTRVGKGGGGADYLGIYKVDGDTLTLCYNGAGSGRPTAFEGQGKGSFTEVYKRVGR